MDPILPEDLSQLSDDELREAGERIAERAEELGTGELTDDAIRELEELGQQADRLDEEAGQREQAAEARRQRAEAALARFRPADEIDEVVDEQLPEDEPGEETEPVAEDTPAEPVAATVDEPAAAAAESAEPAPEPAPAPGALSTARPATGSLSSLKRRRPAPAEPRPAERNLLVATNHALAVNEGTPYEDRLAVARAIVRKRMAFGANVPSGIREPLSIATGEKGGFEHVLSGDAESNFAVLEDVRHAHQAIVATGGNCAPATPLYDFYRLAVPQNPVEQALNVVQAPRGAIRYITPPDYRDARAGIGVTTEAEDAAGYTNQTPPGTTDPKPFVRVACPPIQEAEVDAVHWSVRWGNLQYRTFPEQVAAFMEDLAVGFASRKEEYHLDYIDAHSTPVSSVSPYGASRGILFDWTRLAVAYRKRNGMRRDATIQVFAPDWAVDLIKADLVNDANAGLDFLSIPDSAVNDALRARGLDPTWFNDSATALASTQRFAEAQAAGALNPWPTEVTAYFFAPGTFVRLDGGTLDVGLYRDSELNRTNDLELFFEEWIGTVMLGIESIKHTATVCPNGTAAALTTPFSCS